MKKFIFLFLFLLISANGYCTGYTRELTASIIGSVIGMEPKDFADSLWMNIPKPSTASYGKVIKYNPTTGLWTAQQDSCPDVTTLLPKISLGDSLKANGVYPTYLSASDSIKLGVKRLLLGKTKWILDIFPAYPDTTFAGAATNDVTLTPFSKVSTNSDTTIYIEAQGSVTAGIDTTAIVHFFNPKISKMDSLIVYVSNDSSETNSGLWIKLTNANGISSASDSIWINISADSTIKGFKRKAYSLASVVFTDNPWILCIEPRCYSAAGTKQRISNIFFK